MKVNLLIGELVLHGLPASTRDAIVEELRQAVATQVGQGTMPTSNIRHDVVDAGSFSWTSQSGRELTSAIAGRVSRAVLP